MRLLAFLAAACLAAVPVNASPSFDRAESSYPYESGSVTLNHDASLIAVLLDGHVEDAEEVP